ncbi:hypothetical protein [Acidovorax sp. NCPPB 4044]|uniref:hypothetical protein n=1 Tax=Acidovorax sp. NCPPB 4044 TaxID=2940490 RepID=UPI0023043EDF|nr:hypothetical protein [Acidovorax sp. NCPPB 4044]MDA8522327.1 hypothetical protein [Acidovorax sp. NCPPB 4044]
MAMFFHVVGRGGSGKSTLILAYAEYFERKGKRCAGQDPFIFHNRADALREQPGADVYFIEHCDMRTVDQLPGEMVIQMSRSAQILPAAGTLQLREVQANG